MITWYMVVSKLIIIPALGHQNKGKSSFTGSGLFVLMSHCGVIMSLPTTMYHVIVCYKRPIPLDFVSGIFTISKIQLVVYH